MYLTFAVIFMIIIFAFKFNVIIQKRKGFIYSVAFTFVLLVALCIHGFYSEGSDYARESQTFKLILVNFIVVLIPSIITLFAAWFCRNLKPLALHSFGILVAIVNTASFPFIALFTGCYTGLDCI